LKGPAVFFHFIFFIIYLVPNTCLTIIDHVNKPTYQFALLSHVNAKTILIFKLNSIINFVVVIHMTICKILISNSKTPNQI